MPRKTPEKAAERSGTGNERRNIESRPMHHRVPAVRQREANEAGTPVEAEQEKRSKRADVGEAAEQGGSGDRHRD